MAYTLPTSFDQFISKIEVTRYSRDIADGRTRRIKQLLGNKFEILDVFPIGSLPKFTAVKGHSDLDLLVVLHYTKHVKGRKPSNVLLSIKNALGDYGKIRRNGQAVSVSYSNWPNVDIVPVSRKVHDDNSVDYYNVPNMHDESWIKSRPVLHSNRMSQRNNQDNCGPKFKKIVKMAKWWNHQNGNFLTSYHIEVMALEIMKSNINEYSWHLYRFFEEMEKKVHTLIYDGLNYVTSDMTFAQKTTFDSRLANAVRRLSDAWYFGTQEQNQKAIEKYRVVFGSEFPSYG